MKELKRLGSNLLQIPCQLAGEEGAEEKQSLDEKQG